MKIDQTVVSVPADELVDELCSKIHIEEALKWTNQLINKI